MMQNSKFTIQLLEKIGAPLAAAIESVDLKGDDTDVQAAKLMAQMLGQAVQVSISLNGSLNVVEDEAQADSTRLSLAALAAPLIGEFYKTNGGVPEDQDIKRIIKSMESVVAFADNFTPAEDGKSRLATIDHDAPLFDKTQASLVVMQVMSPVILAVAEFSFGHSETKLTQEIAARLEKTAQEIAIEVKLSDKLSELMILKALCTLYAECHHSQTQKLASSTPDEGREEISLDPVWAAFDLRAAMIKAVMGVEPSSGVTASAVEPAQDESAPAQNEEPAQNAQKPGVAIPSPEAKPEIVVANAAPVAAASAGPMGFFKKPDANAAPAADAMETPAPVEAATPVVEEPAPVVEQPAAPPANSAPVTSPAEPAQETTTTEAQAASTEVPPSSPMGFFKKKEDKAE